MEGMEERRERRGMDGVNQMRSNSTCSIITETPVWLLIFFLCGVVYPSFCMHSHEVYFPCFLWPILPDNLKLNFS